MRRRGKPGELAVFVRVEGILALDWSKGVLLGHSKGMRRVGA